MKKILLELWYLLQYGLAGKPDPPEKANKPLKVIEVPSGCLATYKGKEVPIYDPSITYEIGDIVEYSSYLCKARCTTVGGAVSIVESFEIVAMINREKDSSHLPCNTTNKI